MQFWCECCFPCHVGRILFGFVIYWWSRPGGMRKAFEPIWPPEIVVKDAYYPPWSFKESCISVLLLNILKAPRSTCKGKGPVSGKEMTPSTSIDPHRTFQSDLMPRDLRSDSTRAFNDGHFHENWSHLVRVWAKKIFWQMKVGDQSLGCWKISHGVSY